MQSYIQTTCESCLASCLLFAVNELIPVRIVDHEHACLFHALTFSKDDFAMGHVDYITTHFPVAINRLVDSDPFAQYLGLLSLPRHSMVSVVPITVDHIKSCVNQGYQPIVYLDDYDLLPYNHCPHFVVVTGYDRDRITIMDPWNGLIKDIHGKVLEHAITSLKRRLYFCPQILLVSKRTAPIMEVSA